MTIDVSCHVADGHFEDELLFSKVQLDYAEQEDFDFGFDEGNITLSLEVPEGTELCKLSQKREYTRDFEKSYEWEFSRFDWDRHVFKPVFHKKVDAFEATGRYRKQSIEAYQKRIEAAKKLYQKMLAELIERNYVAY